MSITKSIINNVELEDGAEFYAQASHSGQLVLSIDGQTSQYSVRVSKAEAQAIAKTINNTLKEMES